MKILVCIDGSAHSQKAIEKAALVAEGPNIDEVAIIHVDEGNLDLSAYTNDGRTRTVAVAKTEKIEKLLQEDEEKRKQVLQEALEVFEKKNIKARTILKKGHPPTAIMGVVNEEGFDMIFIGSRGLSGFKKLFLGSVSNAIVQEAKNCSVVLVK